ncbi:hypothetical protein GCM10025857_06780 [Alicyclobacillus contaminans]|uniref:hypothetical protein n=1 Tax=Alicyclobacillus contaminans TaxID=392016 RepID=UPI000406A9E3|nr:hypothetical protein [Alicyclobacillus contaminans]GMA49321.1 hypothetical protein GCM10025857_06780 [Alicyclobacillus contaminans]
MAVENIIHALAGIEKKVMPQAQVYENLPESIGTLPSVLHWLAGGSIPWDRDVTYTIQHDIDVRVFFGRADAPQSDVAAKPWIEKLRQAIDADPRLGGVVENSGVTGYRYGMAEYGGTMYLMLGITVRAIERVVAGGVPSA